MTEELTGAADVLTGAVIARVVEPESGEGRVTGEGNCLNCGTTLVGMHCHQCGQKAKLHRTLHEFGHDILHSVLHFDGKIWRTLPMLFWKPGDLTRRYVHGERAKFVSPLALFLFTVFLTFAVFNWLVPGAVEIKNAFGPGTIETSQVAKAKTNAEANIARMETDLSAARKAGKPTEALKTKIKSEQSDLKVMNGALAALGQKTEAGIDDNWRFTDLDFPGADKLNDAVKHATENPQLLVYKMQSNAYKFSWALIPISVPFVWLLFFWRRRFKMFDHAVFVTYSLTFMMMLTAMFAVLIQYSATEVVGGLMLAFVPPIHLYRQLHHAYETSRFGAFWRMCVLLVFAMAALTLFVMPMYTAVDLVLNTEEEFLPSWT